MTMPSGMVISVIFLHKYALDQGHDKVRVKKRGRRSQPRGSVVKSRLRHYRKMLHSPEGTKSLQTAHTIFPRPCILPSNPVHANTLSEFIVLSKVDVLYPYWIYAENIKY